MLIRSRRSFALLSLLGVLIGCSSSAPPPSNPVPALSSLSPSSANTGSPAFTLSLSGSGFISSSQVFWNGSALPSTYVSGISITAQVPASNLASPGMVSVTVQTPSPGGGTSSALSFTISNPAPTLSAVSPANVTSGSAAISLSVTGSGFVSSSQVLWNGSALTTTFVSSTSLTAQVPASDLTSAGNASVAVQTPSPGGGTSSALSFIVNNPVPTLTTLSPASISADSLAFTLTVTGTNFTSSSQILWNGAALSTTYVSGTSLTAQVPASDVSAAGTASVDVITGSPGGGTSAALTFTIAAAATNLSVIPLQGSDLAWDAAHSKLYVAVPSTASSNASSIVTVDPVTGSFSSAQQLSTSPSGLAVSDDGQFLYAVVNGANSIQRFILPAMTSDIQWSVGTLAEVGEPAVNALVDDVQVQPGAPHTIAVSLQAQFGENTIAVFDDNIERSNVAGGSAPFYGSSLRWKSDGSALYSSIGSLTDAGGNPSGRSALWTMPVTASGVGAVTTYDDAFREEGARLLYDAITGYVYDSSGEAVNPSNGVRIGRTRENRPQTGFSPGPVAVLDGKLGRFFELVEIQQADNSVAFRIQSFDQNTFQLLGTVIIPNAIGGPTAFVRWGQSGLAFVTRVGLGSGQGNLYIVDGTFVNPSGTPDTTAGSALVPVPVLTGLSPLTASTSSGPLTLTVNGRGFAAQPTVYWNGTALPTTVVNGTQLSVQIPASDLASPALASITASNSGSSIPSSNSLSFAVDDPVPSGTQISVLDLGGNYLAWDAVNAKLYVSVPGVQGDAGDAIAIVDPVAGTVSSTGFFSDPDRLSVSDGSQYLYVGIDGQDTIDQLSLPSLSLKSSWSLGGQTVFGGPYYALDLRSAPGSPDTTAVTRAQFDVSPSAMGVVIYDDSVPRPTVLQNGFYTYFGLEWGASSSVLYAFDQGQPEGFLVLNVSSSGATFSRGYDGILTPFSTSMHFDKGTGLLYADAGQVIQPSNGSIVSTFNASGLAVPDSTLNRVFILGQTAAQQKTSNYTIESFDQTAFTPISSLTIENVVGTPTALVRWGTNGLAFTTRGGNPWDLLVTGPGHLYIISGDFVQSSTGSHSSATNALPRLQAPWITPPSASHAAGSHDEVHSSPND